MPGWTAAMLVVMQLPVFAELRSSDSRIIEQIAHATGQSQTFRQADTSPRDDPNTLRVFILNHVELPHDVAREAQSVASEIFLAAGVKVLWIDSPRQSTWPRRFWPTVILVSAPPAQARLHEYAMGSVPMNLSKSATIAYVFYARVQDLARQIDITTAVVLGHVMAHEIGHVLLGRGSHSSAEIMRAEWDRQQVEQIGRGWLSFTADQAEAIRARLSTLDERLSTCDCLIPNP